MNSARSVRLPIAAAPSIVLALLLLSPGSSRADIPATPVMTVYRFNGPLEVPTYDADGFARRGTGALDGTLTQGTSVVPCLIIRGGAPLTDESGTPFVGFEVVVDSRDASPPSTARFRDAVARQQALEVRNHHCPPGVDRVVDVRSLAALDKAPFFDPPRAAGAGDDARQAQSKLDRAVRAFHASRHCDGVQRRLIGRRAALDAAWDAFAGAEHARFGSDTLERARNLDYVLRTAIYEGHLDRGCGAYGACERSVIALSIRNRGRLCRGQGCRFAGDFQGVASAVSQYNIWDEVLTQVSGLAACFLRADLSGDQRYAKLQAIYEQSRGDVERILYGDDDALAAVFPDESPGALATLRHYYHPPAMGKCFPDEPRIEFMSGAIARRGEDFALIAGTRIEVGAKRGEGYEFRDVALSETLERDVLRVADLHPGFVVDARKVSLEPSKGCSPWGTPPGCRSGEVGRHRKVPSWLSSGRPMQLTCAVRARDEACSAPPRPASASVGGPCDTLMQPVAGVP